MRLTNDCINTFISVPNIFIDNYMSKASGEFVKVYLYTEKEKAGRLSCFPFSGDSYGNRTHDFSVRG